MKPTDFFRKALNFLRLDVEIYDYDKIHETIEKDIIFKGTNLWILIFAILVASAGLNMNSAAVVIGAMLISPLMGPINGIGYSIAAYDFELLKRALRNFMFMVITSLVASTAYFAISPISTAHSELLSRTSPTIYDVFIAWFGGLAGIIAVNSKQKGNVIPGVAIATALMPPLCTAGFGLATGQLYYFMGALYLFTINSVFIALASIVISRILKLPIRAQIADARKKKVTRGIAVVTILVMAPSMYFGYLLVQKEIFLENVAKYVRSISVVESNYLLKNEIDAKNKSIKLLYAGASLSENQKISIAERAQDFSLNNLKVEFQKGLSFDEAIHKTDETDLLKIEIIRQNVLLLEKELQIDSLKTKSEIGRQILAEIRMLYPQIVSCAYAESRVFQDDISKPENEEIVVFKTKKAGLTKTEKEKIEHWLAARLKSNRIKVYYEK